MNNDEREQGNTDFSTIKPAAITLTRAEDPGSGKNDIPVPRKHPRLWAALAGLSIVAVAVVFVLPQVVKPPVLTADADTASVGNSTIPYQAVSKPPIEASPWQEAQEARQRAKSQELLSQLLKLQEQLEQKNVLSWAAEEYNRVLGLANEGDAAYRQRDFELSTTFYGDALGGMATLLDGMDRLFEEAMIKGNDALNQGDSVRAGASFELALLMKPEDVQATSGMQRSRTLDQVLKLITEGNDLQQNNQLEPARETYEQALTIDKLAEEARRQIASVNAKIRDRDFNRLMSEGYTHLQKNNLEQAKASFQRAIKLKPNAGEATAALSQTQTGITNDQIQVFLSRAAELEKQENWNEAVTEYDKALALDASLLHAQEGRRYATARTTLDARLEQAISEPHRLNDKAVYEETRVLYQQAVSSVDQPGDRLSRQLVTLNNLLEQSTKPVTVTLTSDNMTEVVIYKVGTLGKFTQKSLTLLPGKYTAIGTREGYRDVRIEITVEADKPVQPVVISAEEKVASR